MPRPTYNHPVEVAGQIMKVTPAPDQEGVYLNLHSFNKTYRVFVPDSVAEDLDFELGVGTTIRAMSTHQWRKEFWLAQSVRVQ